MPDGDLKDISERDLLVKIATEIPYIKEEIKETREYVGKQIEGFNNSLHDSRETNDAVFCGIDERLDKIESWKDKISGGFIAVSILVTTAWGKILKIF